MVYYLEKTFVERRKYITAIYTKKLLLSLSKSLVIKRYSYLLVSVMSQFGLPRRHVGICDGGKNCLGHLIFDHYSEKKPALTSYLETK